jgi:hypothetical protein
MNKDVKDKLRLKVKEVGQRFSNPDREFNFTNETFEIEKVKILSENTALAYYKKNTGKKAVFFFYYIKANDGYWNYFVPTDSHILGMINVNRFKQEIEDYNFEQDG